MKNLAFMERQKFEFENENSKGSSCVFWNSGWNSCSRSKINEIENSQINIGSFD